MKHIRKLNRQILETVKMINSTTKLLKQNPTDEILLFMLNQDKFLLKSLKQTRTKELLDFLKHNINSAEGLLKAIYPKKQASYDPFYIAQEMGIEVIENNLLSDDEAGQCYINDSIIIEYKPQASTNRENFSIAHELGHIVKHMAYENNTSFKDSSELLYARNDYYDSLTPQEQEADSFAGHLLIPEESLKAILSSLNENQKISATLISNIFNVSKGTVYHALKSRGLYNNQKILKDLTWEEN